jgi:Domain of unknown function (DUF5069)
LTPPVYAATVCWIPRSPHDTFDGLVWLPRLIEKARRRARGTAAMNGYLYGDRAPVDRRVLRFLRTDDRAVSTLVAEFPDDTDVARLVLARSGRTDAERRAFSAALARRLFDFAALDADEGRLPHGVRAGAIAFGYNVLIAPRSWIGRIRGR